MPQLLDLKMAVCTESPAQMVAASGVASNDDRATTVTVTSPDLEQPSAEVTVTPKVVVESGMAIGLRAVESETKIPGVHLTIAPASAKNGIIS